MDIKPMYDTNTIKIAKPTATSPAKLENKVVSDPSGVIPNGIYKVIYWEKVRQLITLITTISIIMGAITINSLYIWYFKTSWISIIIPTIVAVIALWKMFITIFERKYLKRSVLRYIEDLRIGLASMPPFITKLYGSIIRKQIRHNWATFFLMFYGGITTLILWWLKDVSWWIFDFDLWIKSLFSNPDVMVWVFATSLIGVVVIHIVLSIQRKKRQLEIDAYFGTQVMPQSDINALKSSENKMFWRIFVMSLMLILIIPIIVKIVLKIFKRK